MGDATPLAPVFYEIGVYINFDSRPQQIRSLIFNTTRHRHTVPNNWDFQNLLFDENLVIIFTDLFIILYSTHKFRALVYQR